MRENEEDATVLIINVKSGNTEIDYNANTRPRANTKIIFFRQECIESHVRNASAQYESEVRKVTPTKRIIIRSILPMNAVLLSH